MNTALSRIGVTFSWACRALIPARLADGSSFREVLASKSSRRGRFLFRIEALGLLGAVGVRHKPMCGGRAVTANLDDWPKRASDCLENSSVG